MGIALEARQLDKLEETIKASPDVVQTLTYALKVSQTLVINREFRQQVGAACGSCASLLHSQQNDCCCPQVHAGYQ